MLRKIFFNCYFLSDFFDFVVEVTRALFVNLAESSRNIKSDEDLKVAHVGMPPSVIARRPVNFCRRNGA